MNAHRKLSRRLASIFTEDCETNGPSPTRRPAEAVEAELAVK